MSIKEQETEFALKQMNIIPSNIELILGFKVDLPEEEIKVLLEKSLKKSKESKESEIISKMIENIKLGKPVEDDSKLIPKSELKTKFYNVVQYDKLTPTIAAYYYCKKSSQTILSDKDAAEYRSMNINNEQNNDNDDEKNMSHILLKGSKNDLYANRSNSESNGNLNSINQISKNDSKTLNYSLKRKRRPSSKIKKDLKKLRKISKTDDFEELLNSRNYANYNEDDDEFEEDQKYCTSDCFNNRKYEDGNEMIECDECKNWYHPQCIKMSEEEFERFKLTEWRCSSCKK